MTDIELLTRASHVQVRRTDAPSAYRRLAAQGKLVAGRITDAGRAVLAQARQAVQAQAKQLAAALRANADAFFADRIDHAAFSARQGELWAGVQGTLQGAVQAELRGDAAWYQGC